MAAIVRMPEVATGAAEAAVASWLVEVGAAVAAGQPIVEIETEKAVVEFDADAGGVLAEILLAAGDAAAVGTPIAVIATGGQSAQDAMVEAGLNGASTTAAAVAAPDAEPPAESFTEAAVKPSASATPAADDNVEAVKELSQTRLFASPLVRRLAKERGVDLSRISGTGPDGRIVRRDLDALSDSTSTAEGAVAHSIRSDQAPTAFTDTPHTGMRRAIARRLTESKATVPHFYLVAHCRVDELIALRARINDQPDIRVSMNDLVIKAVAATFQEVPEANAIWTDDATRQFADVDIAVAVAVPNGLLTPVVRTVQRQSISDLSTTVSDLAERARAGKLKQSELEGGSFTVSNLGMYGTSEFTAIINPPQSGILAVGAAAPQPVVQEDGSLGVATIMTVTLSADHRVLDGALAAEWLAAFQRRIENPVSILL